MRSTAFSRPRNHHSKPSYVLLLSVDTRIIEFVQISAATLDLDVECRSTPQTHEIDQALAVVYDSRCVVPAISTRHDAEFIVSWNNDISVRATSEADRTFEAPRDQQQFVHALAEVLRRHQPSGRCIAVVGARGGAGATTFAAYLASAAAETETDLQQADESPAILAVDCDPLGSGLLDHFSCRHAPGRRWNDYEQVRGYLPQRQVANGLPGTDRLAVLGHVEPAHRSPISRGALESVLYACVTTYSTIIVDVARGGDELQVVLDLADTIVMVSPSDVHGVRGALAMLNSFPSLRDAQLVVRGPAPTVLTPHDVRDIVNLPLAGWCPEDKKLTRRADFGRPPHLGTGYGRSVRQIWKALSADYVPAVDVA